MVERSDESQESLREAARGTVWARNGLCLAQAELPRLPPLVFRSACARVCADGGRLLALCALPPRAGLGSDRPQELLAVLGDDARSRIALLRVALPEDRSYPALTTDLPQAQAFERELFEEHAIRPEGHPWLKPLRQHADLAPRSGGDSRPHPFFRVEGPSIHEVAVGPVHAGIIEPGHFRFQCDGEIVRSLEIQLGYQHRGAESLLLRSSPGRRLAVAESIAGDTSVGHALAYSKGIEALGGTDVPLYAQAVRGIALELERIANHVGDLGALCNDVGYLPGDAVVGLSKLARLVEHFAARPQTQERLTRQVANCLAARLNPRGAGVVLEAEHACMTLRGVRALGTTTVTSALLGALRTDARSRSEFFALAGVAH